MKFFKMLLPMRGTQFWQPCRKFCVKSATSFCSKSKNCFEISWIFQDELLAAESSQKLQSSQKKLQKFLWPVKHCFSHPAGKIVPKSPFLWWKSEIDKKYLKSTERFFLFKTILKTRKTHFWKPYRKKFSKRSRYLAQCPKMRKKQIFFQKTLSFQRKVVQLDSRSSERQKSSKGWKFFCSVPKFEKKIRKLSKKKTFLRIFLWRREMRF